MARRSKGQKWRPMAPGLLILVNRRRYAGFRMSQAGQSEAAPRRHQPKVPTFGSKSLLSAALHGSFLARDRLLEVLGGLHGIHPN
jgi:hypothetical protein